MRLILASASPARLATLRAAGLAPEVVVSHADESRVADESPAKLAARLAELKARSVFEALPGASDEPVLVLGCDSVLEFDGQVHGKPGTPALAAVWWTRMRGRDALLHTGHHVIVASPGRPAHSETRLATTLVAFADLTEAEIASYAATGEPQRVAGGFTIDGLGGPFITRIEGDPHNVVGVSLPLLRQMLLDAGVPWCSLWRPDVVQPDE